MPNHESSVSSAIRACLAHPVIDADGHWLEFSPAVIDYLKRVGGSSVVEGFRARGGRVARSLGLSPQERHERRIAQEAWWGVPAKNTRDRATAMLPRLLYERLDELGIDFEVLYPTAGLAAPFLPDEEIRRATCRAFNMFLAEYFDEFKDRITPAAVIPMHTPAEAIEELEHVVGTLKLKVVMMASMIRRPNAYVARKAPESSRYAGWFDPLGIDSDYDYDPVWQKCAELGVSPTFHSGTRGLGFRTSPSNFVYNHIGHFAVAGEAVCKALFLGGVTRRFPEVKFAFLEGGVGWACNLLADLVGHWKTRGLKGLEEVNPDNLDRAMLADLVRRYGDELFAERLSRLRESPLAEGERATGGITRLDDFAACGIERPEDIRDLFVPSFYFGCEADDPMNAWAFNRRMNPMGARLNTLFGSDIGHFDVPDMSRVLAEAHELVETDLLTEEDFRDFVFANPVRFWAEANPGFFRGTAVEAPAAAVLRESHG